MDSMDAFNGAVSFTAGVVKGVSTGQLDAPTPCTQWTVRDLLNHVIGLAHRAGATLRADFVETGRNRMMQITYAFAGFAEVGRNGNEVVLECAAGAAQRCPSYVELRVS